MQPSDITVKVRDKTLAIVGTIPSDELDFMFHKMYANIGAWTLKLPVEHPMVPALKTPGSGIVVLLEGKEIGSGPTLSPDTEQNYEDPLGTITFTGATDTIITQDALAWPDPANQPSAQAKARDKRTGPCETLMHGYVRDNIGPGAIASRRNLSLVMGTDGARGKTVTRKPRFHNLGTLLAGLARSGRLGFEVIQIGSNLEFRTYAVQDKTATMVLDVEDGSLQSVHLSRGPLTPTAVIVGGSGHGDKRLFREAGTIESKALSDEWGRRIETYMDYRGSDDDPEGDDLVAAGREWLEDEIQRPIQLNITPGEYAEKRYGVWELGDKITVNVAGTPHQVTATGLIIRVDANGARYGVSLGDPVMSDDGGAGMGHKRRSSGRANGSVEERLFDLETSVPDLTDYTLDGVDYVVDHRVLLLEPGQTVPDYEALHGVTIQPGTVIFEKA